MKILQSSFFRSLCAIVVGVLLIQYREETVRWITILMGVMFFLSGVISIISYYVACRQQPDMLVTDEAGNPIAGYRPVFPIVGLGSLIFGVVLALMPTTFITGLTLTLAAFLILGAVSQYMMLLRIRKLGKVSVFYWLLPSVTLLVGLVAIVHPQAIATAPLFVIGWCMLLYGVAECLNAIKMHNERKQCERADAERMKTTIDSAETAQNSPEEKAEQ